MDFNTFTMLFKYSLLMYGQVSSEDLYEDSFFINLCTNIGIGFLTNKLLKILFWLTE